MMLDDGSEDFESLERAFAAMQPGATLTFPFHAGEEDDLRKWVAEGDGLILAGASMEMRTMVDACPCCEETATLLEVWRTKPS
jgi:hypothetical protein